MTILLYIFKLHLRFIYFFIKLFTKQERQVFFLSRQYNKIPLNYSYLIKQLKKQDKNIKIKVICKKVDNELNETLRDTKKCSNTKIVMKKISKQLKSAFKYYINIYVQMYIIAKSRVVIVDGYNLSASMLKHKKNTTIIQIWHALAAMKKFGYQSIGFDDGINPKLAKILEMHKNYDYVISGSDEMKKPFSEAFNVPIENITSIGTPYVDFLLKNDSEKIKKVYEKHPELKGKINIVYSPTFRKDGRDYIKNVIDNIDLDKYNLIITYHSKDENKKELQNSKLVNCSDVPYNLLMKIADYVITDYSALSVEVAIVQTKLLLYVCDIEKYNKENGLNVDLFKELPGYTSKNISELVKIIDNGNYDINVLNKFREKYISNLTGTSTKLLCEMILKNVNKKQKIDIEKLESNYKEKNKEKSVV